MPKSEVRAHIRKAIKNAEHLERGTCNPCIERHVTTAALSAMQELSPADYARIENGGDASFLDQDFLKKHYQSPAPIPKAVEGPVMWRHWTAAAFDKYMVARTAELRAEIGGKKASKQEVKKIGWLKFQKLEEGDRKSFLPPGYVITKRPKMSWSAAPACPGTPDAKPAEFCAPQSEEKKQVSYKPRKRITMEALGSSLVDVVKALTPAKDDKLGLLTKQLYAECCDKAAEKPGISLRLLRSYVPKSMRLKAHKRAAGRKKNSPNVF